MLFNSLEFLAFFPLVVLIYYLIPRKIKYLWILVVNFFFYSCWSPVYALILFGVSVVTYLCGLAIGRKKNIDEEKEHSNVGLKLWVAVAAVILILCLCFFKYYDFVVDSIFPVLDALKVGLTKPSLSVIQPIGISFYTLQALGYVIDVYRGKADAEKNFFKYTAFVSFFPLLSSGPIERAGNVLRQFEEKHTFCFETVKNGILLMLWGFFQKMVIADRLSIVVNQTFDYYRNYSGIQIMVAVFFFSIQLYCDFAGYSNIAIGAAQVMGFKVMNNFDCPYFSQSVAEFWRRWHISLSSWFRDYLYFPLGGSRCSKKKKYRNIMIVFLVNGLWHGASWHYVVWGGLNGLFQVIGYELQKIRTWVAEKLKIDINVFSHKLLKVIVTFILVDFAWIFFRAPDIKSAFLIIGRMFTDINPAVFFNGSLYKMNLEQTEFGIAIFSIFVLFFIDILHYKGIKIRETLSKQGVWFRYIIYLTAIFSILILGEYGPNFDAAQFIYMQF